MISLAKAIPLIVGASGGLWISPHGGTSPLAYARQGDTVGVLQSTLANYTFYSANTGSFQADQGAGLKALLAGVVAHKAIGWFMDA
jgi:hypothetical protein